jgi:hypothetical protein
MAPLTGSDAMHYHFTVQRLILEQDFDPLFSNSRSFLCGQHHLLVALAIATEFLSISKTAVFVLGSLVGGISPYSNTREKNGNS